ncbi:DUF4023 family protein [Paenibacillus sp. P96]|uniref:DUF4023 family protein n=1 Tax=Paenibacillus zeirhizosphaerae TaxID=2987519 RepID=A0ABT9FM11_9BACL|nr:DUF4023 family protein [Paenibacillus sp. P96]MDP4095743.1 DUF4023 family protein [Paenibacillus sp. P96]
MDNTHDYVEKLHENQKKQAHNRKKGHGTPSEKLSTKQHSKNP